MRATRILRNAASAAKAEKAKATSSTHPEPMSADHTLYHVTSTVSGRPLQAPSMLNTFPKGFLEEVS